jgi:hypothetical protein
MRDRKWLVKFVALAALTMATTSPLFAADDTAGFTRVSVLLDSRLPNAASPVSVTRAETAGCACGGVPFPVVCPGNEKAICRCNPPGFKCSK